MFKYKIIVNGTHFSDAMKEYSLIELFSFLNSKEYSFIKACKDYSEYKYETLYNPKEKTILEYNTLESMPLIIHLLHDNISSS